MTRHFVPAILLVLLFVLGCASPATLARRSGDKLAQGDMWRAWSLATKALDKAPANHDAMLAAESAGHTIATDWRRRVRALAEVDSLAAAEQVLEFEAFRAEAAYYTQLVHDPEWPGVEHAVRHAAARQHYALGVEAVAARRPKKAHRHLTDALRFVMDYRDASKLASESFAAGRTTVAFVPLDTGMRGSSLGRDVADAWRGELLERMPPSRSTFTRFVPALRVDRVLRVADLDRMSRKDAVRIGRKVEADRVVWGAVGDIETKNSVQVFSDRVARKIREKDENGRTVTRWEPVSIEVIARVRTVAVDVEHEVLATRGGATLARHNATRRMKARVVWTSYTPLGDPSDYRLIAGPDRKADPKGAKAIERRWRDVVGEGTTLAQVLRAKRNRAQRPDDRRKVIEHLIAGAAFVMLEELPAPEELAYAALVQGAASVHADLARLDPVDDVDLGIAVAGRKR